MSDLLRPTKRHLLDLRPAELADWLKQHNQPAFRARQIRRWLFAGRAASIEAMTDLPAALRQQLAAEFSLWSASVVKQLTTQDGTEKLLLGWPDGHRIECVLLREGLRRSICISTQVGCAMGCVFCASGLDGVARNLTTGEILEQILRLDRLLPADERLSHIVIMGMGEPLANLQRLLPALSDATAQDGLNISARRITISTVGLPAAMNQLADLDVPYHLAVSLHAPDDQLRNQLVPVSRKIGISQILQAADRFFQVTGRRITYEYVLLAGLNDQPAQARRLATLLQGRNALVNLIPFNPVEGLAYQTPSSQAVTRFVRILEQAHVQVQIRKRKGDRINAACGQLRRSSTQEVALAPMSPQKQALDRQKVGDSKDSPSSDQTVASVDVRVWDGESEKSGTSG